MSRYRYTLTFSTHEDEESFPEQELRSKIEDIAEEACANNIKVCIEDDSCIKENKKKDAERYFITGVTPDTGNVRCFGFVRTLKQATEALANNSCDMHECLYRYAVVEKMHEGIHPTCEDDRVFFEWDDEKKGFFEIEEPEEFKMFCNFALG